MRKIGFSHGVLFKLHDVYTKENIQIFIDCGSTAVEINCHHAREVELPDNLLPYIKDFDYVSLHTPVDTRYSDNAETRALLAKLEEFYINADAQLAVIHPELVDDWSIFDEYKINWAIENMDDRKDNFKNVADIKEFFSKHPTWKLVLDVGHSNINDKTMVLTHELIAEFKERIAEIHLSGYEVFHDPLYRTKQIEIIHACRKLAAPIIIESTFEKADGIEGIKNEFNYILENLK